MENICATATNSHTFRGQMKHSLFRQKSISSILETPPPDSEAHGLKKHLKLKDLTAMGIAAIIGSGIFSTIGTALSDGGPATSLLYIFTAVACAFSALCYAEFASRIPLSGSAYTYAYVTFGEVVAWIIGWDLIMEYAVGNIAVAISWSDYFSGFMADALHMPLPAWTTTDLLTAESDYRSAISWIQEGHCSCNLTGAIKDGYEAWITAPVIMGCHVILDIPAVAITVLITWIVFRGIKESKTAGNVMVLIKLLAILFVIGIGSAYIDTDHWDPFAPNGIGGVLKGVSGVFFAYIGFDAISTTAEECDNPQRDLPRSMFWSLGICTVIYVVISLVLTGMIPFSKLNVGDPLALAFKEIGLPHVSMVIAIAAIVAIASVLLVFQMGQPRIWMSMSRDGLLPPVFSKIHKKYKTPGFSTILTGILVAVPASFLTLGEVTDMTSIGTLFAFMLVCGGVMLLEERQEPNTGKFRVPYFNGRYAVPAILLLVGWIVYHYFPQELLGLFKLESWSLTKEKIPMWLFLLFSIYISWRTFRKKSSLIPVLGLLTNGFLVAKLSWINWVGFSIWMLLGLAVYFIYGFKHSKLNQKHGH